MADSLTVTVAQPTVVSYEVAINVERHAEVVDAVPPGVVVFPELSLTGYELAAGPVAPDDERLMPLVEACVGRGSVALVGAPVVEGDGSGAPEHLAMLAVGGAGDRDGPGPRVVYRKVNLGGDEAERFDAGPGPAVLEVDSWRLGLAICKDTGVADHARSTAALGLDAYLAGVCEHADDHGVVAERATRIATDHRCWVAVASFAGSTGEGYDPAAGGSGVWGPDGAAVVRAGTGAGEHATATLTRG